MIDRVEGQASARETPIGALPQADDIHLDGVALSDEARRVLFGFDRAGWQAEFDSLEGFLDEFGERMPDALKREQGRIAAELRTA